MALLFCVFVFVGVLYSTAAMPPAVKQRVSEEGVNRVIKNWIADDLHQFILKYEEKKQNFTINVFGGSNILISNLNATNVEGLHGHLDILTDQMLHLSVGFTKLSFNADIMLKTGHNDTDPSAPTTLHLLNSSMDIRVQLAPGNDTMGINITACETTLSEFDADGEIAPKLEGLFKMAHHEVAMLSEKVCPFVQDQFKEKIKKLLVVREGIDFVTSTNKTITINYISNTMTTDGDHIEDVAIPNTEDQHRLPVSRDFFPKESALSVKKEVDLWINAPLMVYSLNETINQDFLSDIEYKLTMKGTQYDVEVNVDSVDSDIIVTQEGMGLLIRSSQLTLRHKSMGFYSIADCVKVYANLAAVIPFYISFSDADILIAPDVDRLQLQYTVSSWNGSCPLPNDNKTVDEMQKLILKQFNVEFEKILTGKTMKIQMPYQHDYITFQHTVVELVKDAFVIATDLRVAPSTVPVNTKRTVLRNKRYTDSFVHYIYSTGTKETRPRHTSGVTSHQQYPLVCLISLAALVALINI